MRQTHIGKYKRATIIGMYRNGAKVETISVYMNLPYERVKVIVEAYFKVKIND